MCSKCGRPLSPLEPGSHTRMELSQRFFIETSRNNQKTRIRASKAGTRDGSQDDPHERNPVVNKTRTVVTGAAALAAMAVIGACSTAGTKDANSSPAPTSAQSATSAQAAPHNRADMMFAHMMIPHHEQAIEMSDIILSKQDIDPRVVDLATQIKAAQGPEIEQMQGWLKQWGMKMEGMPPMGDMPGHGGMGNMAGMEGMMSPAQMEALKNAQGLQASELFLTGMIEHHEGALTMAQDEITNGQFPDAITMAKSILQSQQTEIDTMNQILDSL